MAETPAAELREAAKLMRERAGKLGGPPCWRAHADEVRAVYQDADGADLGDLLLARCTLTTIAGYFASMHPSVALAVADLLEAAASCGCGLGDDHGDIAAAALAVARAYLGSDPQ